MDLEHSTGDAAEDFDVQAAPATPQASPPAPVAPQAAPQVQQTPPPAEPTLVEAWKVLREVEKMPTRNAVEEGAKQQAMFKAQRVIAKLQQLPELSDDTKNEMGRLMVLRGQMALQQSIEIEAKSNPMLAALLAENAALRAKLAAQK